MLINGKDIMIYGGKILSFTSNPSQKDYMYEFLNDNALTPIRTKNSKRKFKVILLEIEVQGDTEQQFDIYVGELTRELTDCEIVMDDRESIVYKGHLQSAPQIEMITSTSGKLSCEIYAICEGKEIRHVFTNKIIIQVEGNSEAPAILELTSNVNLQDLQITGLTKNPIMILSFLRDSPFIIDGDKCTVKQDGKNMFSHCDMWQFPMLTPGIAKIELSISCNAILKYKPRYV